MHLLADQERLLQQVKAQMTEQRYQHTLRVAESARKLAQLYGADEEKAVLAGYVHDYCKCWPQEKLRDILLRYDYPELLHEDRELWHSFAGAIAIQTELGIDDPEVIQAVRYHTTGRTNMSLLEKVVLLADYIEPGRNFPGVEEIRAKASKQLNEALALALGGTIRYLLQQNKRVYPLTLMAYNDLVSSQEG